MSKRLHGRTIVNWEICDFLSIYVDLEIENFYLSVWCSAMITPTDNLHTHVQYTRSVTGHKKDDASRRIVTVRRVVTTRHESSPTVSTVTREVVSRKGIAEVNFSSCISTPEKVDGSWRSETSRQVGAGRDDRKGVWIYLVLQKARTSKKKPPNTVTAVKQPCTNKQDKKVCEYTSF